MNTFIVEGELDWAVSQEPDQAGWVGVCDALGITVEGRTWKEFTETANEVVHHILTTHLKEGTLPDLLRATIFETTARSILKQCGFSPIDIDAAISGLRSRS